MKNLKYGFIVLGFLAFGIMGCDDFSSPDQKIDLGEMNLKNLMSYGDDDIDKSQVVIVFDDSGSMDGRFSVTDEITGTISKMTYFEGAIQAVKDSSVNFSDDDHEISLFALNNGWMIEKSKPSELVNEMNKIQNKLRPDGGTNINNALLNADDFLENHGSGIKMNQIIIISDGDDNFPKDTKKKLVSMHQNSMVIVSLINFFYTNSNIHIPTLTKQIDATDIDSLREGIVPVEVEDTNFNLMSRNGELK